MDEVMLQTKHSVGSAFRDQVMLQSANSALCLRSCRSSYNAAQSHPSLIFGDAEPLAKLLSQILSFSRVAPFFKRTQQTPAYLSAIECGKCNIK